MYTQRTICVIDLARQIHKQLNLQQSLFVNQKVINMKILKVFVLPLLFVAATGLQAMATSPSTKGQDLRNEIVSMVDGIDLSSLDGDSEKVTIEFLVNAKKELVVLNIEDSQISKQILHLLDRRKVKTEGIAMNKLFILPITFNKN